MRRTRIHSPEGARRETSLRRRGCARDAFTLIELLVVVAILGILAALLFPLMAAARERAHQSACASNLGQLGKAFALYAEENDGAIVSNGYFLHPGSTTDFTSVTYVDFLSAYTNRHVDALWRCPGLSSSSAPIIDYLPNYWWNPQSKHGALSYLAPLSSLEYPSYPAIVERSVNDLFDASEVVILYDGWEFGLDGVEGLPLWKRPGPGYLNGVRLRGRVFFPHSNGFNALFADGHVKRVEKSHWRQWVYDPRDPDALDLFENNPNLADP